MKWLNHVRDNCAWNQDAVSVPGVPGPFARPQEGLRKACENRRLRQLFVNIAGVLGGSGGG